MHPEYKIGNEMEVFFTNEKTGEVICGSTISTAHIEPIDKVEQEIELLLHTQPVTITATTIVTNKDLLGKVIPQSTVIIEKRNLPRGNKLPKRKRIRNKWIKKYVTTTEIETTSLELKDGEIEITGFMK